MSSRARLRSEEERALLSWAAGLGAVSAAALARREACSLDCARARLSAAARRQTMRCWRPLRDAAPLYTVTASGIRALGVSAIGPARVSAAGMPHAHACCEVAVALERSFPDHRVIGEQALRGDPVHGRVGLGGPVGASARTHRPDLLLVGEEQIPIAVEIELTLKAPRRLAEICRAWARAREVAGVLYVTSPCVHGPLQRAIAQSAAHERIVVVPLASLVG